jgi:hypothetical protein
MFLIRQSMIAATAQPQAIVLNGIRAVLDRCRVKRGKLKTKGF